MNALNTLKLPPKPGANHDVTCWINEKLWGHRIFNIQPWLIFLEFLSVCEAKIHSGEPPLSHDTIADEDDEPIPLVYSPARRIQLRNILKHAIDEKIEKDNPGLPDSEKWDIWEKAMCDASEGYAAPKPRFSYVSQHFQSFRDFNLLAQSLRGFIVEETENKRWSSQFLFPFGADTIYEDLKISKDKVERDRIYFTRSGELLYDMLCRSKHKDELNQLLPKLLRTDNPWNHLCRLLQNPDPLFNKRGDLTGSILPYKEHPRFDLLGQDFCAILKLDIPVADAIPHLVTLAGLHLLIYVQEIACATLDRPPKSFICEILSPQRTTIRACSIASFDENRRLSADALDKELENIEKGFFQSDLEKDAEEAKKYLKDKTGWDTEESKAMTSTEMLFATLKQTVCKAHRDHLGKVHSEYGRGIGLVSRRGSNRNRYVPSDDFLRSVTLATVPAHTEFKQLMNQLHEKYYLVFGVDALGKQNKDYSKSHFKENSRRLERRLGSLGLLKRKSDGCAYVSNPHSQPEISS